MRDRLRAADKDDITGLEKLPAARASAANDPRFRTIQDALVDGLYYWPAMKQADRFGIRTALGKAMLYDAIVQHGGGDDADSLAALLERTQTHANGTPSPRVADRSIRSRSYVVDGSGDWPSSQANMMPHSTSKMRPTRNTKSA